MKILFKIILMTSVLQSCKSQPNFDLTELSLKSEKISSLVPDIKNKTIYPYGGNGTEYVITKNYRFLNFNGVILIGRQSPNSKRGINGVSFYYNKKDSIINQYGVSIYSEKQAKDLLNALIEKLGKPDFTSYMRVEDKIDDNFDALLWEETTNNHLYLIRYGLDGTVKASLEVKNNSTNIQDLYLTGEFGYWEDFLLSRKQKGDTNYTYQDYLKDELKNDPENLANQYTK